MRHLSLQSSLPILESNKTTVALLCNQLSLIEVVENQTPRTIAMAADNLGRRAERQDYFNTDFLGDSVRRITKTRLILQLRHLIQSRQYNDNITAAHMNVLRRVRLLRDAHFFDIRY